jgi:hypothetical protein
VELPRNGLGGSRSLWIGALVAAQWTLAPTADAVRWPWNRDAALAHPDVESRAAERAAAGASDGAVRFAVFGDQRALADGEWQSLLAEIARLDREEAPVDLIVDTGDVVTDGRHTDQFAMLHEILAPLRHRPYLVAIGNHELRNNASPAARAHSAALLGSLDPAISPERLYYREDLGPVALLFLDTNDFVYGERGEREACPPALDAGSRTGAQLAWLREELAALREEPKPVVVVVMHHPLVQSSRKHREASRSLWNTRAGGEALADLLADGGVDLILTGHTHTYERFLLTRADGASMHLVNLSGRPRDAVLWFGAAPRRARDIRGGELDWLREKGWRGLDAWEIRQEDVMLEGREADQFALCTAGPDGDLLLETFFLDAGAPGGFRRVAAIRLR